MAIEQHNALAPPTAVGPMEPLLIFFLLWMHCEEKLKLSTGENKSLLRTILDPPLPLSIERRLLPL